MPTSLSLPLSRVLHALPSGQQATVSHFTDPQVASKLMAMGVLPGSPIEVVRRSPFGGNLYVRVEDRRIALRKQEALCIVLN